MHHGVRVTLYKIHRNNVSIPDGGMDACDLPRSLGQMLSWYPQHIAQHISNAAIPTLTSTFPPELRPPKVIKMPS